MKSAKTTISLFLATIPILYCGGLVYYLNAVPGHLESTIGLPGGAAGGMMKDIGPTMLGLGALGVLFAFAFIIRLVRASSKVSTTATSATAEADDEEPFDADAALARYLARKAAGGEADAQPASPAPAVSPRAFGRKTV